MADRKWQNPVRSEMGGKVPSMVSPNCIDRLDAPFNKPHDMGNGGIPLEMMTNMGEKTAVKTMTPGQAGGLATVPNATHTRPVSRVSPPKNKK